MRRQRPNNRATRETVELFEAVAIPGTGRWAIRHKQSKEEVGRSTENDVFSVLDTVNAFARRSHAARVELITRTDSVAHKTSLQKVHDLVCPKQKEYEFTERPKDVTTYSNSGPRKSFLHEGLKLTAKEAAILAAIEEGSGFVTDITARTPFNHFQVNGSISVLLAKGVVRTLKGRDNGELKRKAVIDKTDWRTLVAN